MNKLKEISAKVLNKVDVLGKVFVNKSRRLIEFVLTKIHKEEKENVILDKYRSYKKNHNVYRISGIVGITVVMIISIAISNGLLGGRSYKTVVSDVVEGQMEADSSKIISCLPEDVYTGLEDELINKYSVNKSEVKKYMIDELNKVAQKSLNKNVNWKYGYNWTYSYEIENEKDYSSLEIKEYLDGSNYSSGFDAIKSISVKVIFKNNGKVLGDDYMYLTTGKRDRNWYFLMK